MTGLYKEAYSDFVKGEGRDLPTTEHCTALMLHCKSINEAIDEALTNKKKTLSIMPYGDNLAFVHDASFVGHCTTTIPVSRDGHELLVHFDRN
jgi:hypothetical protein